MTTKHLRREIELFCPPEEIFSFFADATNLERLTPPWLRFRILSSLPITMQAGAIIRYRLRLHGIPIRWTSKITAWDPPKRFVDEQLSGPFQLWVHEHSFEASANGTLARDHVEYKVPGGALIDRLFVRRDLEKIFDYRAEQLEQL